MIKTIYCNIYNLQEEIDSWLEEMDYCVDIINVIQSVTQENGLSHVLYTIVYEECDDCISVVDN